MVFFFETSFTERRELIIIFTNYVFTDRVIRVQLELYKNYILFFRHLCTNYGTLPELKKKKKTYTIFIILWRHFPINILFLAFTTLLRVFPANTTLRHLSLSCVITVFHLSPPVILKSSSTTTTLVPGLSLSLFSCGFHSSYGITLFSFHYVPKPL